MRLGYLGPPGTFSDEALRNSQPSPDDELVDLPSIHATIMAVQQGAVDRALVPIENAIEGGINATVDTLAADATDVEIIGEALLPIRTCLIARRALPEAEIELVVSHPQPLGQCAALLHGPLAHAEVRATASTAEAVRMVSETDQPWAALGPRTAAERYGCEILRDGVDDESGNVTRFVWLARARDAAAPVAGTTGEPAHKTSVLFAGAGDAQAGWLVRCLSEFAFRGVNLTRIESRPQRGQLGHYVFHVDLEGRRNDPDVSAALAGLATHCESVRTLGSYPVAGSHAAA